MLTKFESFDSGSNYRFGDKLEKSKVSRSLCDLSHTVALTYPKEGAIIPITWFETLIGADYDINVDALLRFQPLVVPPYSRSRLFIYGFYSRFSDLWNNWQSFFSRGRTGDYSATIPCYHPSNSGSTNLYVHDTKSDTVLVNPDNIFDYLGLPIGLKCGYSDGSAIEKISVLPQMMCFRVWRDYFCCADEYINDRVLFPHDDSRFRVDNDGKLLSALDANTRFFWGYNVMGSNKVSAKYGSYRSVSGSYPGLVFDGMWHEFAQDYFISAKPFLQRGNAPYVQFDLQGQLISKNWESSATDPYLWIRNRDSSYGANVPPSELAADGEDYNDTTVAARNSPFLAIGSNLSDEQISWFNDSMVDAILKSVGFSGTTAVRLYTDDLRKLLINQLELEKMAHTDGSYGQFGIAFFGERPKSAYDYRPIYIGGTYKPINFSQVLQTSQTVLEGDDKSYLGAYAGHGIAGLVNGRIGHLHSDDMGICMLFAVILPDTYYSQGLDRKFTRSTQEEFFLTGREKLGMQPILNKELYAFGTKTQNNGLFAYQDAWDEYRYIPNAVRGKMADSTALSWFPYTQSRHFESTPSWGHNFSTTQNNVRGDFYTSSSEDICSIQFGINIRAVQPLPYRPTTGQIIN